MTRSSSTTQHHRLGGHSGQILHSGFLKVPLSSLPSSKENVRSVLNGDRQRGVNIATASDDNFLYIWKPEKDSPL